MKWAERFVMYILLYFTTKCVNVIEVPGSQKIKMDLNPVEVEVKSILDILILQSA